MISYTPIYSHGGSGTADWPAVVGNAASSGRPVSVLGSLQFGGFDEGAFIIIAKGSAGTADVVVEVNGGMLNSTTSEPPPDEWCDVSDGGWTFAVGDTKVLKCHAEVPYWRTRITGVSRNPGDDIEIVSYIPLIRIVSAAGHHPIRPQYPVKMQDSTAGM